MGQPGAAFQRTALPGRTVRPGKTAPILLAAALFIPFASPADEAEDLRASIVVRCLYHVGEFGSQLVDICVRDDLAAAQALRKYPASIVDHCAGRVQGDGWTGIKMCADAEMAAEEALSKLGPQYATTIVECRAKAGAQGSAKVKACVDGALKPGR
jgi:hypothetical protein